MPGISTWAGCPGWAFQAATTWTGRPDRAFLSGLLLSRSSTWTRDQGYTEIRERRSGGDDEKQTCAEAQHTGPITLKDRKVYNSRLRRSTAFIKNGNLSLSLSEFLSQEIRNSSKSLSKFTHAECCAMRWYSTYVSL
jgi:hypothetical protein